MIIIFSAQDQNEESEMEKRIERNFLEARISRKGKKKNKVKKEIQWVH